MQISYFLGTSNNPLYNGNFKCGDTYLTFGQHSFLYDLTLSSIDKNIGFTIYVDNLDAFPLLKVLRSHGIICKLLEVHKKYTSDIIIFDSLSDEYLQGSYFGYKLGVIHNYMIPHSKVFYESVDAIVCLTPMAIIKQNTYYPTNKYLLIRQGVYCKRFTCCIPPKKFPKNVLFYSRMDNTKGECYKKMVDIFLNLGISISMLGAGELFEHYKKIFSGSVSFLNHVPCYEINNIISQYDLIVSNGRGVMESMSSNIPAIAVGVRYCGLITKENVVLNRDANFTGGFLPEIDINIENDINLVANCFDSDPFYFRNLATKYLNVDDFVYSLINNYNNYVSSR